MRRPLLNAARVMHGATQTQLESERKAPAKPSLETYFRPWMVVLVIGSLILGAYPEVLFGSHSFFHRDFGLFTYGLASYQAAAIGHGELPLWNPLSQCGIPFAAQWSTTVYYPGSLLYVLLPLPWSLNFYCLAHLFVAGLSMYFLALRWTGSRFAACIAAVAFAWSGIIINSMMWTSTLATLAWMPTVVLWVQRGWQEGGRALVLAALVAAIQMLAGSPEIILLTWIILGALALSDSLRHLVRWRLVWTRSALVVGLVTGICAVQLLPFLDLFANSERDASFNDGIWAMPIWGWANLLVPLFRCSLNIGVYMQPTQGWTSSYYSGAGVLALALVGLFCAREPRLRLMAIIAFIGAVLALGENLRFYNWLKEVLPVLGVMRYAVKFVVLTTFSLPLMAAFAIAALEQTRVSSSRTRLGTIAAVGACMLGAIGFILITARFAPAGGAWDVTLGNGISRCGFVVLALGSAAMLVRANTNRMVSIARGVLLLSVSLDCFSHMPRQHPTVSNKAFTLPGIREVVTARPGEARTMIDRQMIGILFRRDVADPFLYVAGNRQMLFMNYNLPEEVPSVSGFYSLRLGHFLDVHGLLYDDSGLPEALADFVGVAQITSSNRFEWDKRRNFMPLVTAGQKPVFASREATLAGLTNISFNPRETVYLPLEAQSTLAAVRRTEVQAKMRRFSAHRIEAEVIAPEPTMVVIAQAYYHPWRAYVDGSRVSLWRANHAFQALQVSTGVHTVEWVYEDGAFRIGGFVSLITILLCGLMWWRTRSGMACLPADSGAGGDRASC